MKVSKRTFAVVLNICLASLIISGTLTLRVAAQAPDSRVALQRGYRTGYSDGYMAGYRDTIDNLMKDYSRHGEYARADRAFSVDYGIKEDYRDGYQQGFESGYDTGFDKRSFEASLPSELQKRGTVALQAKAPTAKYENTAAQYGNDNTGKANASQIGDSKDSSNTTDSRPENNAVIIIPRDTEFLVELQSDLNTEQTKEGERFTAKIVSPSEMAGAIIEGRVSKIHKPGRLKRRPEILLSFDRITLNDARSSNFSAVLTEVTPVRGDNIKFVDNEGTAIGNNSLKSDGIKIGAATTTGLVIGAVAGGPVGAAVGAGIGAAVGVGAVVIDRGNHIRLNRNQQLRIKTACEMQIH